VRESSRFKSDAMDINKFLTVLRSLLDFPPALAIATQEELDEATDTLCEALILALNASTPKRRPSSYSKKWWTADAGKYNRGVSRIALVSRRTMNPYRHQ
jgi:hypothetical protein